MGNKPVAQIHNCLLKCSGWLAVYSHALLGLSVAHGPLRIPEASFHRTFQQEDMPWRQEPFKLTKRSVEK